MKSIYVQFQSKTGISKYMPMIDMAKNQIDEWNKLPFYVRLFIRNQLHQSNKNL